MGISGDLSDVWTLVRGGVLFHFTVCKRLQYFLHAGDSVLRTDSGSAFHLLYMSWSMRCLVIDRSGFDHGGGVCVRVCMPPKQSRLLLLESILTFFVPAWRPTFLNSFCCLSFSFLSISLDDGRNRRCWLSRRPMETRWLLQRGLGAEAAGDPSWGRARRGRPARQTSLCTSRSPTLWIENKT